MSVNPNDNRIVDWAPYGKHINLRCKLCGKKFHTKNIDYIGARTIFYSDILQSIDVTCEHPEKELEPIKEE